MDGCMDGGIDVRKIDHDELALLNDFASNVNIVYNGVQKNQNQILSELYYDKQYKDASPSHSMSPLQNTYNPLLKKKHEIPEEPKPIEPGQVDPALFFGSSLQNLF